MFRRARTRLYLQLEPAASGNTEFPWMNRLIIFVILASVVVVILESEPTIHQGREALFEWAEVTVGLFFTVEYLARLWVCAENPRYADGIRGRLRYMLSPTALLDLLAIAPLLIWAVGAEVYLLRIARLFRVLRLAKLGRCCW